MAHNLCIDIGNTRAKWAVFSDRKLIASGHNSKLLVKDVRAIVDKYSIEKGIISSTRHEYGPVIRYLSRTLETFFVLSHKVKTPLRNKYGTPSTLGMDRIAAAVGAYTKKPGKAHLVIDAGSCMTLDVVDAKGNFLGGNISPGMRMRIKAMNDHTDKLPLVDLKYHDKIIAKSTKMALQNGAVHGTLLEIEGFIKLMQKTYKGINTTLTGGDAIFLAKNLKIKIFAAPNLVLDGLNEILYHNV